MSQRTQENLFVYNFANVPVKFLCRLRSKKMSRIHSDFFMTYHKMWKLAFLFRLVDVDKERIFSLLVLLDVCESTTNLHEA